MQIPYRTYPTYGCLQWELFLNKNDAQGQSWTTPFLVSTKKLHEDLPPRPCNSVRHWIVSSSASWRRTHDTVPLICSSSTYQMGSSEYVYGWKTSQHSVWLFRWALGRNHSSCSCSLCPWVGWRVHHTSAAPPKPWWTSSIYTPLHPGTHHGILWNLQQEHNPHRMIGTAFPSQHPHSLHHHDSWHRHNFPCPSNATATDHWPMAMSLSTMKFCSHRAHQTNYTSLRARLSTSIIGSSGPTTTMTIQWYARTPSPKANC